MCGLANQHVIKVYLKIPIRTITESIAFEHDSMRLDANQRTKHTVQIAERDGLAIEQSAEFVEKLLILLLLLGPLLRGLHLIDQLKVLATKIMASEQVVLVFGNSMHGDWLEAVG
jgi:hypothetical protein